MYGNKTCLTETAHQKKLMFHWGLLQRISEGTQTGLAQLKMDVHINVFLWTFQRSFTTHAFSFLNVPGIWWCHIVVICNIEQLTDLKNSWQSTNQDKQRVPNKTENILPATYIPSPEHLLLILMFYFIFLKNLSNKCRSI